MISDIIDYGNGDNSVKRVVSKASDEDLDVFNKNLNRSNLEEKR